MYKVLFLASTLINFLNAGYCFKNDTESCCSVTMFDQDDDLVIDRFALQPNQELIFSCKYIKTQKIKKLKIFPNCPTDSPESFINICVSCPNSYYVLYNLKGELLSLEDAKAARAFFKNNINECLLIKRGFLQQGFFLRNIEGEDVILTVKREKDKHLLENFSVAPNGEIYCSNSFLKSSEIKKIKLHLVSYLRSNKTGKQISLPKTKIPTRIRSFDSQIIYGLAYGLNPLPHRFGINQYNRPTGEKSDEHLTSLKHFLGKTYFSRPRTNKSINLEQLRMSKEQKKAHLILENTSAHIYNVQIFDHDALPVIDSIILSPQEIIHLSSSYLHNQSIHALQLVLTTHNEPENEVCTEQKCTFLLSPKTPENYAEKYSIFGEFLKSFDLVSFQKNIRCKRNQLLSIKNGYENLGYTIRNIQKKTKDCTGSIILSLKDDHNRTLLDHHELQSNSEIYFPHQYLVKKNIDYILVIKHIPSSTVSNKRTDEITLIKTPTRNYDSQIMYNIAIGFKTLKQHFPLNQFNESYTKPLPVAQKLTAHLYNNTTFYEPRNTKPFHMKSRNEQNSLLEKEIEGPISPSTKN